MKKIFDIFDMLVALGFGSLITTVLSTAIYALDAPRLLIVLVLALITLAIAVLVSYKIGWRRAKTENLIAYNKGVTKGRTIGKAEAHGEVQQHFEHNS